MVVLEHFYQIVEKKSSKISPLWKVGHISIFGVAAVCSFFTAFTFGQILEDFSYNCVLNAQVELNNSTYLNLSNGFPVSKKVRAIDLALTSWGSMSDCEFAQFTPLVMMISAILWATYFVVMARGGAGYPTDLLSRPWTIMYPCLVFSFVLFIIGSTSTYKLKEGMTAFCLQFTSEFNNTGCVPEISVYIIQFRQYEAGAFYYYDIYANMRTAMISSEIAIWAWVFQLVLCSVRICFYADFELQVVTIMTDELKKVVELSDSDE